MPTVHFAGYKPKSASLFGWDNETVSTKRAATTGRSFEVLADGITCKADGETQGLRVTDAGAFPAYQRKFFFAVLYFRAGAALLNIRTYLQTGDTIVDADSVEWKVESIADPGGAGEHLEVLGSRAPVE